LINEDGFTLDDVNLLIHKIEDEDAHKFTDSEYDLLIDALEFYKEMNYIAVR
jgi:hypothetical protein